MFLSKEKNKKKPQLVSETLKTLSEKPATGKTKIGTIISEFKEDSILIALIFFAMPVAIPLPYPPGFTTIMGTPLVLLSLQLILNRKQVWLPQSLANYYIKNSRLITISNKIVPLLEKVENYVKPRMLLASSFSAERVLGIICLIAAISVTVPLPMTNAIPALGIAVISMGLLNKDGLIISLGAFIAIFGTILAIFFVVGSLVLVKHIYTTVIDTIF